MPPVTSHYGRMASLDLDVVSKASRRPLPLARRCNNADRDKEVKSETESRASSPSSSPTSKTDRRHRPSPYLLALPRTCRRGRRNSSRGGTRTAAAPAQAARNRSRSSAVVAKAFHMGWPTLACVSLCLSCLSCLATPAAGLVIEEPFSDTFDHVAAAFGPDLLTIEPPVESRPLVKARPRDGCTPLQNTMDDGAIALVERGMCNFTQKVLYAQEAGASAVVVTDTRVTEKWLMVMYGDPENAQGIEIPAVLVSHATGERLWSNRSWIAGRQGKLKASVGAPGHIVLQTRPVGAMEMLGIYLLLSVLLLAFSGVCGLLFALAFTWYQRGYRTRAMRKLKSFTFRRRTQPQHRSSPAPSPSPSLPALETTTPRDTDSGTASINSTDGNTTGGGDEATAAAAAAGATVGTEHGRNRSNDTHGANDTNYKEGGVPLARIQVSSPRRRCPRTCEDDSSENCGGGGGHGGTRVGGGDGDESGGKTATTSAGSPGPALSGEGGGEDSSNGDMMGPEDDMCAICLETYEDGDSLTGLPCRHSFHTECIQPWLSGKSALCPMCKSEAFGKGGLFLSAAPRLEAAFAELAALCTENLAVLGLFFLASVACGVIAAKLSLRD